MSDDEYKENFDETNINSRLNTKEKNDPIDFSFQLTQENDPQLFETKLSDFCENFSFDSFLFLMNIFQANDIHISVYDIVENYSPRFIPHLLHLISNINDFEPRYKNWMSQLKNEKSFMSLLMHFVSISTQVFCIFFQNNGFRILVNEIGFKHDPDINAQIFEILTYVLEYSAINGILLPQIETETVDLPENQSNSDFYRKLIIEVSNLFVQEESLVYDCELHDIELIINESPSLSLLTDILAFFKSITNLYQSNNVRRRFLYLAWDIMLKTMDIELESDNPRVVLLQEILHYLKDLVKDDFPQFCNKFIELFTFVSKQWNTMTPKVCFVFIEFFFDIYKLKYEGFNMTFSQFIPFDQMNSVIEHRITNYENESKEKEQPCVDTEISDICLKIIDLMTDLTRMFSEEPELFNKISSKNLIDNLLWICLNGTFNEKKHFLVFFDLFMKEAPSSYIHDLFQHGRFADPNFVEEFIQLKEDEVIQRQRIIYSIFSLLVKFATDDVKEIINSQLGDDENFLDEEED